MEYIETYKQKNFNKDINYEELSNIKRKKLIPELKAESEEKKSLEEELEEMKSSISHLKFEIFRQEKSLKNIIEGLIKEKLKDIRDNAIQSLPMPQSEPMSIFADENRERTKRKTEPIISRKSSLFKLERPPTSTNEKSTTEKVVHHPVQEYSRESLKINLERWIKDSVKKVFEEANQYAKMKNEGSKTNDKDLKEADNTFNRLGEIRNQCSL